MLRVLFELWPALLPALLFLAWHRTRVRKARKNNEPAPVLKDGPWFAITLLTIAIAVACFFAFGLSQPHTKGEYVPAEMHDGKLEDGSIRP